MMILTLQVWKCLTTVFAAPLTQTLIGCVFGLSVALFVERNRKPKLSLTTKQTDTHPGPPPCRGVGVSLVNTKPKPLFAWFTHREPALRASATIEFMTSDRRPFIKKLMQGRWTSSPQPPELYDLKTNQLSPYNRQNLQFREIYPGVVEGIDVAIRFQGEDDCFGYSNASYDQPQERHKRDPAFRLEKGEYIVQVTITYSGGTLTNSFRLRNDVPYNEFRLETE
ncbi:MAG: hypothetical protein ABSF38_20475 [Verrucomicrobiota bacterium]